MIALLMVLFAGCERADGPGETDAADTEAPVCERFADPADLEQPFIDAWCPWAGECPSKHGTYEACVEAFQQLFEDEASFSYDPCQAEACVDALATAASCTDHEPPEPCRQLFEF